MLFRSTPPPRGGGGVADASKSVGLLDRRQSPRPAPHAQERPHLGRRRRPRRIALDHPALRVVGRVDQAEFHRDGGVFALALGPSLGQIARQQAHVGDFVMQPARLRFLDLIAVLLRRIKAAVS